MDITSLFWEFFPWSLSFLLIPIIIVYVWRRSKRTVIENYAEMFFKGSTKKKYPAIVDKSTCKWMVGETVFTEPILYNPRLEETSDGGLRRVYMFAEGIGNVDVPLLMQDDAEQIWDFYIENNIVNEDMKKDFMIENGDWDLDKIGGYIKYYNFEIEQILDKPTPKAFNVAMSSFESTVREIIHDIESMEGGASNKFVLGLFFVAFLVGFGFAWAMTLKGII